MRPEPSEPIRNLILQGNLVDAEHLAYEALKVAPAYPPLWVALGDIEEARGDKDSASRLREAAIQSLRGIAEKGGSSLFSDALEGWVLWKEERMDEAIEPLQRCAKALDGGEDAFVQLLLGSAYLLKQRYLEARIALERAHTGALVAEIQDQAMGGLKVIAATRANVLGICETMGVSIETLLASGEIPESDAESIQELCEAGDLSQFPHDGRGITRSI